MIDANVIIYASGRAHPYREPCRQLLTQIAAGLSGYTTDAEVLQEVLHFYWARRSLPQGLAVFDDTLIVFPSPLSISVAELRIARNLMQRYQDLPTRDAIHAACVLLHGLEGIVSADRHFDVVPELRRFDPREL